MEKNEADSVFSVFSRFEYGILNIRMKRKDSAGRDEKRKRTYETDYFAG